MIRWYIDAVLLIAGLALWRAAGMGWSLSRAMHVRSAGEEISRGAREAMDYYEVWSVFLYAGSVLCLLAFAILTWFNIRKMLRRSDPSGQGTS